MKLFSMFRVELRRQVLLKPFWITLCLSMCMPLLGYTDFFKASSVESLSIQLIANPVLAGTVLGGVLWAVFHLVQISRPGRSGVNVLTDAVASPLRLAVVRMLGMTAYLAAAAAVCACLYLPHTAAEMEYLFHPVFYFANFFVFLFPTWCISVLLVEAFYLITCRIELTVLLYGACVYFSFSQPALEDYFMRWLNPYVVSFSDGFLSYWPLRIGLYTRLMWLCIALGIWLVSLLCIRRYQKNLAGSFLRGIRKVYIGAAAVIFIAAGFGLWKSQPFIDHGPEEYVDEPDIYFPQAPDTQAEAVRYFLTAKPFAGKIRGRAEYDIQKPYTGEDVLVINPGYTITHMSYGGKPVAFRMADQVVNGERYIYYRLPEDKDQTLVIEYEGMPSIAKFVADFMVDDSVDQDYIQLKHVSIVPLASFDCEGGAAFSITIPSKLTPYLDYMPMTDFVDHKDGTKTWTSACDVYLMDFTAGYYVTDRIDTDGMKVDFTYGKAYKEAVDKYEIKEAIGQVFAYCRKHYGKLGLLADDHLLLMQKSIMIMGGHAYPGISEWFETVLSPLALKDPQKGANAQETFIHEMIHQWWGAFGLECADEEIWSSEGLAVYSTYRLVKEKYGILYARQFYVDEWKKAVEKQDRNFYNRHPEYLSALPETYQVQLNQNNMGTNQYMRMPLMLLKAEELLGGEEQMDAVLKKMYRDRDSFGDENPFTYQDFLDYCGLTEEELTLE